MTPDRIDALLADLTPTAGPYTAQIHSMIAAWAKDNPAPPTLDDMVATFIADYPNGHLMVRHDPLRTVGQWTATAYCWRGDGDSPTEATERLRARVVSNTISVLPALPDGTEWTCSQLGTVWRPEDSGRAAWLRNGIVRMTLFGPPPPLSVVSPVPVTGDTSACDERLYVPVKA